MRRQSLSFGFLADPLKHQSPQFSYGPTFPAFGIVHAHHGDVHELLDPLLDGLFPNLLDHQLDPARIVQYQLSDRLFPPLADRSGLVVILGVARLGLPLGEHLPEERQLVI